MAREDAIHWNQRYQSGGSTSFSNPRRLLVENAQSLPAGGLAFDAAMGLGSNANFLTQLGFRVIGVDISEIAVHKAKERYPAILGVVADLTQFHFPPGAFEVMLNFFYLERSLWPFYEKALKPGGILFFETMTLEMLQIRPELDPNHLLKPLELRHGFKNLELLYYREGWIEQPGRRPRAVASLIGRKPTLSNFVENA